MNIRRLSTIFLFTLMLLPIGVSAHCKGKHTGDHPHCQGGDPGGDPGSELALSVSFRCSDVGIDRSCAPTGSADRLQGDGGGAFVEGSDKVNAVLTSPGRFRMNTGGNKKTGSTRKVYMDFTEGSTSFVPLTSGNITTTDGLVFPYRTVIHLNRRNDIADPRNITVGQTVMLDMWADLEISDGGATSTIFVRFDSMNANSECQSAGSQDVPVFRESDTLWIVDVPAGTVGCVYVLDSEDSSNSGNKGDWVMGPFEFEFSAL